MVHVLDEPIENMEETLKLCDEAKALGYPGASKCIVEATRNLTLRRLKEFKKLRNEEA